MERCHDQHTQRLNRHPTQPLRGIYRREDCEAVQDSTCFKWPDDESCFIRYSSCTKITVIFDIATTQRGDLNSAAVRHRLSLTMIEVGIHSVFMSLLEL